MPAQEHAPDPGEAGVREALSERVKELECLYAITRTLHRGDAGIDSLLREVVAILPQGFHYPELASARIRVGQSTFQDPSFPGGTLTLSAPLAAGGSVEVAYPPGITARDPTPFLPEEVKLIEKAAIDISLAVDRARTARETERLESQLRHADRLASVGVLAAGVAHELNEPLATILGFAQLVQKADLPPQAAQDVQQIVDACLRAREVVRNLLIFGGNAPSRTEMCDLGRTVQEAVRFLEPRCHGGSVEVRLDLAPDLPRVSADPAQLTQVVVNLAVNAIQAMPVGGTLGVSTRAVDGAAVLTVRDTGIGMSPDTLEKLFVPFFTTKGTRGGTGLGLAVVHGIISSLNGTISVRSEPGRGSSFEVTLPGASEEGT